jgi:peptidoglycan/LPS O-acetylase OafA/YrhL
MNSAKRILTLDGFRGIFALMIIIDHADNNSFIFQNFIVKNADYFVDYFFVLSGFVISYNYSDKIKSFISFKDFMLRRMIRLYPLLLYTTILFFGLVLIGKHFGTFRDPYQVLFFQLTDTLTMMNSNPLFGTSLGINYPSWSISSEMISYALFGFCLFAFKKRSTLILSICLASAALFILYTGRYMYMGDYGFIRGLFCFIMGYFVYLLSQKVSTKKFGTLSELLFISILLLIFKFLPSEYAIVLPCVFAVGIFVFLNSSGVITHFLESKPAQFLGKISFSVYLNHAIIVLIMKKMMFDIMGLDQSSIFINISYLLISVSLTIFYSYFTNKYIETATGNLLKKRLIRKPARSLAVEPVLSTNENMLV